jgi:hypothetical protein
LEETQVFPHTDKRPCGDTTIKVCKSKVLRDSILSQSEWLLSRTQTTKNAGEIWGKRNPYVAGGDIN